ncbi:MAG: DUF1491 family protein [Alphaproteobacteria bacterium]|nr:DUF1491 family protein [Alphaproteobacteria bacterium]
MSLPLSLWIEAHLRRLNQTGQAYYILHKGAYDGAAVLLKINLLNGTSKLLTLMRVDGDQLVWSPVLRDEIMDESPISDYVTRAMHRDPDVWVVEIEDRDGRNPFDL